ncbi:MAG: pilin [Patescibacteria group bacterium]
MSKLGKSIFFVTVITSLALVVFPVAAQITQVGGEDCSALGISCTGSEDTNSLINTIVTIGNVFLTLVGVVAAIYLVLGGVRYIMSEGETDQTEKAKKTIIYALIGIIVIGISAALVNFVISDVIGGSSGSPGGNSGTIRVPN